MKSMADALTEALQKRMSEGGKVTITFDSEKMGLAPDTKPDEEMVEEKIEEAEQKEEMQEEKEDEGKDMADMEEAIMGGESPEKLLKANDDRSLAQKAALAVAKKKVKA